MSRIGKQPIVIPENVEVKIEDNFITVKGPKGELKQKIHPLVLVKKEANQLGVKVENPDNVKQRSLWGLFQRLVSNMVTGVVKGYEKKLELVGVGYKADVRGEDLLVLNVGYSHPVEFKIPPGVEVLVEKNIVTIKGIDKQLIGEIAAQIRRIRKPEPYKGKGIKYVDEIIRRKAGKKTAVSTG